MSTAGRTTWRWPWPRPTSRATAAAGPAEQAHPDYYVRIVDRRAGGIVVRGAKVHTSVMPNANELSVVPTRNLTEADKDHAVAFCIPVNTAGVKMWAQHNILVNSIAPAYVETDLTAGLRENPKLQEAIIRQTPLGGFAKVEDIVGAAIYLAADASSYVTG